MCSDNKSSPDTLYSKIFAWFYDPFMSNMENKVFHSMRSELIPPLTGDILDVGIGTGINFSLYNASASVVACEPSESMLNNARIRLEATPVSSEVKLVHAGIGDEVLESHVPKKGFDAIISTLVLCTIPNPAEAIETFKRWLKPGGKLVVLEHVHAEKFPRRLVHNLVNPLWKRLGQGCHLTRETEQLLKEIGFQPVWEKRLVIVMPLYQAVMTVGST